MTSAPGPRYRAGALRRLLLGGGWRDVWATPVRAPVFDPGAHAGGLEIEQRGGGAQTFVLHLKEKHGWREYRYRSVDKFPMQRAPAEVRGSLAGRLFQDQVSIFFPAAPLLVPPLLDAVAILHVEPRLYGMRDTPLLGQLRDTAAGMLGTFELKGEEAPGEQPGFAGSRSIKGTKHFLRELESGRAHRLNEREFLAARLVDLLINDPDRTPENTDWARFGEPGAYTWRPIPRDRDQAFVDARGVYNVVARRLFPKLLRFDATFSLTGLTYSTHELDRRLLQRLTAEDFRAVAARVQRAVSDSAIAAAVAQMPAEWRRETAADERIAGILAARRDQLPAVAMAFYRDLAGEVDVHATDEDDRLDVLRHADGRVTVTVGDPQRAPMIASVRRADGSVESTSGGAVEDASERPTFYQRTFLPAETSEIRVFAHGGNDVGVVRGSRTAAITVRLIGGGGDDVLADSAGGAATRLYDAEGNDQIIVSGDTRVDTRPWKPLHPQTGFRAGSNWRPDWGGSRGWSPTIDYNTGAGLILGAGPRLKSYGFRRWPNRWSAEANLMVGTGNGRLGLTGQADHHFESSPRTFRLEARATQLAATRFFGYGNNTAFVGREQNLVDQTELAVEPSLIRHIGWRAREDTGNVIRGKDTRRRDELEPTTGSLRAGPLLRWIDPQANANSALVASGGRSARSFGLAGGRFGLELERTNDDAVPTRGWTAEVDIAAYPMAGLGAAFGTAQAGGSLYVPFKRGLSPHLALRAGGSVATGDYPAQFAAAIGGRNSLRGYSWRRYAGDAAADGSAELRVPIGTLNFIVRSQLGVFALVDAGRVWFDGRSDGGWHSGVGGGLWLSAFGKSFSVAYASGESKRLYVTSGLFY